MRRHLIVVRPLHEHDCCACQLVGIHKGHDLYFCPPSRVEENGSYIARRSSDGPDYVSQPAHIVAQFSDGILGEARRRHLALQEMLMAFHDRMMPPGWD